MKKKGDFQVAERSSPIGHVTCVHSSTSFVKLDRNEYGQYSYSK